MIVEREREIQDFVAESSFSIVAYFDAKGNVFQATLSRNLKSEDEALEFLQKSADSIFSVVKLDKKPAKKSPVAPFTTSTLQQEAGRKLGYAVGQTMSVAQKLYEQGYITYMRTDSTNLSNFALEGIKDEVINSFGQEYHHKRVFRTKNKDAQEALSLIHI